MSSHAQNLQSRIADSSLTVAVIGLGYVGLPLAAAFHDAGLTVLGIDTDPAKVADLQAGRNYLPHLGAALTQQLAASNRFTPTIDHAAVADADVVVICVPTPLDAASNPDLSYLTSTASAIAPHITPGTLVCLESTTFPSTTRSILLPALTADRRDLEPGQSLFVAFSPEREDPGNPSFSTRTIPKLVGGIDDTSTDLACAFYELAIERVVRCESAEIAEAAKIYENVYRAVNIALVNEMKTILDRMGIDIWPVIEAASTKPFGFTPFYPGPGMGGHCIPIDPFYLAHHAKSLGIDARFIELAGRINHSMPGYVVTKTLGALLARTIEPSKASVLILGIAYKPDIADVRESPAFPIIDLLRQAGARVSYHDPHVPHTHKMRHHDAGLSSIELSANALASHDCTVIVTNHRDIDYALVAAHAPIIVDTRNALAGQAISDSTLYVRA